MQVGIFSWICKFGIRREIRARTRKRTMVLFHSSFPADASSRVQSPGQKDPLEEGMVTHSSILAWKIPWTEEPGRLVHQVMESHTRLSTHSYIHSQSREKRMNKKPRLRRSSYQNRRESPGLWKGRKFIKNQWSTASLLRTKKLPLDLAIWRLFMAMTRAFLVKWWGELFLMDWVERKKAVCQISNPGHKAELSLVTWFSKVPYQTKWNIPLHYTVIAFLGISVHKKKNLCFSVLKIPCVCRTKLVLTQMTIKKVFHTHECPVEYLKVGWDKRQFFVVYNFPTYNRIYSTSYWGFPGNSVGKESACSAGNLGSIPGSGRSPGEGNGNPL